MLVVVVLPLAELVQGLVMGIREHPSEGLKKACSESETLVTELAVEVESHIRQNQH